MNNLYLLTLTIMLSAVTFAESHGVANANSSRLVGRLVSNTVEEHEVKSLRDVRTLISYLDWLGLKVINNAVGGVGHYYQTGSGLKCKRLEIGKQFGKPVYQYTCYINGIQRLTGSHAKVLHTLMERNGALGFTAGVFPDPELTYIMDNLVCYPRNVATPVPMEASCHYKKYFYSPPRRDD